MGQRKNGVKNYQRIFINKCQLTLFVVATKFQKRSDRAWSSRNRCMNRFQGSGFWVDFELWWWRSNSLLIVEVWCWGCRLGVQAAGSIRQEEEQDASKNLLADMGVCGFVTLGGQV